MYFLLCRWGMCCTWVSIRIVVRAWCVCSLIWVSVCCECARVVASQGTHDAHIHFGRSWSRQKLSSVEEEGVFPHLHAASPCFCLSFFPPTWCPFFILSVSLAAPSPSSWQRLGMRPSFPSAPALTPALELLTKVSGSGWGKRVRKKLRRQGRS